MLACRKLGFFLSTLVHSVFSRLQARLVIPFSPSSHLWVESVALSWSDAAAERWEELRACLPNPDPAEHNTGLTCTVPDGRSTCLRVDESACDPASLGCWVLVDRSHWFELKTCLSAEDRRSLPAPFDNLPGAELTAQDVAAFEAYMTSFLDEAIGIYQEAIEDGIFYFFFHGDELVKLITMLQHHNQGKATELMLWLFFWEYGLLHSDGVYYASLPCFDLELGEAATSVDMTFWLDRTLANSLSFCSYAKIRFPSFWSEDATLQDLCSRIVHAMDELTGLSRRAHHRKLDKNPATRNKPASQQPPIRQTDEATDAANANRVCALRKQLQEQYARKRDWKLGEGQLDFECTSDEGQTPLQHVRDQARTVKMGESKISGPQFHVVGGEVLCGVKIEGFNKLKTTNAYNTNDEGLLLFSTRDLVDPHIFNTYVYTTSTMKGSIKSQVYTSMPAYDEALPGDFLTRGRDYREFFGRVPSRAGVAALNQQMVDSHVTNGAIKKIRVDTRKYAWLWDLYRSELDRSKLTEAWFDRMRSGQGTKLDVLRFIPFNSVGREFECLAGYVAQLIYTGERTASLFTRTMCDVILSTPRAERGEEAMEEEEEES